jgi:hypothetical protein
MYIMYFDHINPLHYSMKAFVIYIKQFNYQLNDIQVPEWGLNFEVEKPETPFRHCWQFVPLDLG